MLPKVYVATVVAAATVVVIGGVAMAGPAPRSGTATQSQMDEQHAADVNCTIIVPDNPLSAQGLATPYELTATNNRGNDDNRQCQEQNPAQSAFVEATIIDPNSGALSVYRPLVINRNSRPAVDPVTPTLPAGAIVGIWFGFNGTHLTLRGRNDGTPQNANCVNGLRTDHGLSVFGQVAYCNAQNFFQAANSAISAGKLKVPPLGTAADGMPCPTTRDFSVVDQDQSDNVDSTYIVTNHRGLAQNTAANRANLTVQQILNNGSDNGLLNGFIQPSLSCKPFAVPDIGDNGTLTTTLATNELQAAADQQDPIALVPLNDPMTLVNNKYSTDKTNLYRTGVDQPPLSDQETPRGYCNELMNGGAHRVLKMDRSFTVNFAPPIVAPGQPQPANLFIFLQNRLKMSIMNLKCRNNR